MASSPGNMALKPASILGVPPEIRLRIYGYVLKTRGAVDTVLLPKNKTEIMRNGLLARGKCRKEYDETLVCVLARLNKWNELSIFFVCRRIYVEATAFYYNCNTFDFYSPKQCLDWFMALDPNTARLVRSISLPLTNLRGDHEGRLLMETLLTLACNLRTLYAGKRTDTEEERDGWSNVRSWPVGVHDPGYWNKWMLMWCGKEDWEEDPMPPCGPYRLITAAGSEGAMEVDDTRICVLDRTSKDFVLNHLSRFPELRAVYLNEETFSTGWDAKFARVLAELKKRRPNRSIFGLLV